MKSKKQSKKVAKSGKAGLKSSTMGKVKSLGLTQNHNETLVLSS